MNTVGNDSLRFWLLYCRSYQYYGANYCYHYYEKIEEIQNILYENLQTSSTFKQIKILYNFIKLTRLFTIR